ncbi:hypothetical protein [Streptomyces sp. NPDC014806]|uniref:hypothetical protein n=1 Tax=Streptomyces sp. NPDC014806 TaxID=3364920 RepID=UPI00370070FB
MIANTRMNAWMSAHLGAGGIRVREEDVPEPFRLIVHEGWTVDGDAHLLTALRSGYHGTVRSEWRDVIPYEAAVNGRGMMDYDLPEAGRERLDALLRRSLGYACIALRAVPEEQKWPVLGYVSLSEGGLEGGLLTAHVTFCSERPDLPRYVDDVNAYSQEALLEISQQDVELLLEA